MNDKEAIIRSLTQMLAPKLFVLCGDKPDEMGFPFGDDEADLKQRMGRQFDPVTFWTEQAREIAEAIVETLGDEPLCIDDIIAASAVWANKWQPTA